MYHDLQKCYQSRRVHVMPVMSERTPNLDQEVLTNLTVRKSNALHFCFEIQKKVALFLILQTPPLGREQRESTRGFL